MKPEVIIWLTQADVLRSIHYGLYDLGLDKIPAKPSEMRKLLNAESGTDGGQCPSANLQSHAVYKDVDLGIKRIYDKDGKDWWVKNSEKGTAEYRPRFKKGEYENKGPRPRTVAAVRKSSIRQTHWKDR